MKKSTYRTCLTLARDVSGTVEGVKPKNPSDRVGRSRLGATISREYR